MKGSHGASTEEVETPVMAGVWRAVHFDDQRFRHR